MTRREHQLQAFRSQDGSYFKQCIFSQARVLEEAPSESSTTEVEEVEEQNEIDVSSSEDENDEAAFPDTQINLLQPIGNIRQDSSEPKGDEEIIVYSQAVKSKKITTVQHNKKKLKG